VDKRIAVKGEMYSSGRVFSSICKVLSSIPSSGVKEGGMEGMDGIGTIYAKSTHNEMLLSNEKN
jgi:hypothetical protein